MPRGGYGPQSGRHKEMPKGPSYRFKVGDRVLCKTGSGWEAGRVILLNYRLPGDPTVHPYQVQLTDDWRKIYVPFDDDQCCKLHNVEWWEDLMAREDLSDEEGVAAIKRLCKGKDVNAKNFMGDSALHVCLRYKWLPGVEALLQLHADPNIGGNRQERPLNMAVCVGTTAWVKILLEARADPTLQDEDPDKDPNYASKSFEERQFHRSALHYAATSSKELTMILLEARADVNQADAQDKQPLHLAMEEDLADVVDVVLANGAEVNTGNISIGLSSSPLNEATHAGNIDLMEKLIEARSDLNRQGRQEMTPLHLAARGRHLKAARLLLEAGADVNIKAKGKTAAQLAATNGAAELACMLGHKNEALEGKAPVLDAELRKQLYID
mmetsp:Transcript_126823/g.283485  ORF Transcript_126823/g.283485 Transcript_126823/m.283485 type:complete len:383 (+) Transcript_126823:67-1215(+)